MATVRLCCALTSFSLVYLVVSLLARNLIFSTAFPIDFHPVQQPRPFHISLESLDSHSLLARTDRHTIRTALRPARSPRLSLTFPSRAFPGSTTLLASSPSRKSFRRSWTSSSSATGASVLMPSPAWTLGGEFALPCHILKMTLEVLTPSRSALS